MKRKPAPAFSFLLFLFSFLICLISCNNKTNSVPPRIIPKDKMVDVLVDIHLAEAAADNHGVTRPEINLMMATKYDSIFQKHETTFEQFNSSYDYYMDHPDAFSEIYSEVVNKLTTQLSKVRNDRKIKPSSRQNIDSASAHLPGRDSLP